MYALNIDKETDRIMSATFEQYAADGMPIVKTLPDGDISDYLYINGKYEHKPLPKPEPEPKIPSLEERNRADIDFLMLMGGYDV